MRETMGKQGNNKQCNISKQANELVMGHGMVYFREWYPRSLHIYMISPCIHVVITDIP